MAISTSVLPFVAARVLVVDDNDDAARMMSMLLEVSGYEVEVASEGVTALECFTRQLPDVVLCDIGLPGMNGYEVARRIRLESQTTGGVPILIALTGYDSPADRARAIGAGFDHHCAKPVDFDKVIEIIKRSVAGGKF